MRRKRTSRDAWKRQWRRIGSATCQRLEHPRAPQQKQRSRLCGPTVQPAPLSNYFVVGAGSMMFHGGIASDPARASFNEHLLGHATRSEVLPGTNAFAFQVPLFRTSGSSGSAVAVDLRGDDLETVQAAASTMMSRFEALFGGRSVQPDPSNFATPGIEVRVRPDQRRLADAGLSAEDVTLSVAAAGDGALIGEYNAGGDSIDLVLIARASASAAQPQSSMSVDAIADVPVALSTGQLTPPPTMALEDAVTKIHAALASARSEGVISANVVTDVAGTASALAAVRKELIGDGTVIGTVASTVGMALLVCYLVMAVLFQSFLLPFVIMFSVPVAAVGGFAALFALFIISLTSPTMPMQSLDVLTMLGFVILIGVVVNNAILIVHQAINFQRGTADETPSDASFRGLIGAPLVVHGGALPLRAAIAESVRTRVRPILMSAITSVAGMIPLVFAPGAGSELYRGLGAVMGGGLLVSTIFTIVLVPLVMAVLVPDRQRV